MEDFFALLKEYLLWLNLDDASESLFMPMVGMAYGLGSRN